MNYGKRVILLFTALFLFIAVSGNLSAQERAEISSSREVIVYTFFVNYVVEPFPFPLFGFVNIAKGNHNTAHIGYVNWNSRDFSGFQAGFVNTVSGDLNGVQAGFVNTAAGYTRGVQAGFVNTAVREVQGLQLGFVNTSVQKINGMQIGFINYADSIENGIPIGFISIVRNGGYRAVEYGFTEFHPLGLGLKLGVEKFYTSIFVSYNPVEENAQNHFSTGFGIGSIIPINPRFFFNMELNAYTSIDTENNQLLSLTPLFGYKPNNNFSITLGPTLSWAHTPGDVESQRPVFKILEHTINEKNSIFFGVRAALRIHF